MGKNGGGNTKMEEPAALDVNGMMNDGCVAGFVFSLLFRIKYVTYWRNDP